MKDIRGLPVETARSVVMELRMAKDGLAIINKTTYALEDGIIDLEEAWDIICAAKKAAGLPPWGEILKEVGESIAHKHYGGELISGSQKGYDIFNGERIQVKARSIKKFKTDGSPKLATAIKFSTDNFDKLVIVTFRPDDGSFYQMIEFTKEQLLDVASHDGYDNTYTQGLTSELYFQGKIL